MAWHGRLTLDYRHDTQQGTDRGRTVALDRHEGPLRVLQRLYPEGPGICHHVLVHPPGGIVGGDRLEIEASLAAGSHALITTPGATRFYRSAGAAACQSLRARLAPGSRLEWLPLETIAYDGALAENRMVFELAPGAEMLGWDLLALGLPAADLAFQHGRYQQHLELPGRWLERGLIRADDRVLLDSPLGLAGRKVLASLWFAAGQVLPGARREALLEAARAEIDADALLRASAGCTAPEGGVVVLRLLADRVEPAMALLTRVRAAWRRAAWGLAPCPPRVWRT
ncbi:MAG TPA: urease accessory protein UreD [Roseateles sp.]|nr:urease accessory protein UreD [Roseateles sp.]